MYVFPNINIAVIIPCYNEEVAIPKVIKDFSIALPNARIYVYDNNSSDRTSEVAQAAGAFIGFEPFPGKGNVMRRMFSDIDADIYVLVDGDDTYDSSAAPDMVRMLIENKLDMVNGVRVNANKEAYRLGHRFGNIMLTKMVATIFGSQFTDMLSGYRVFSRRFVKSFPALTQGFEIETELTVHALELRMKTAELPANYKERPNGSISKLNTVRDGFRILRTIAVLVKEERPMWFFGLLTTILGLLSLGLAAPIFIEYSITGLVPRFPTAILSSSIMLLAFLSLTCGIILDSVSRARREIKRLAYLSISAPDFSKK